MGDSSTTGTFMSFDHILFKKRKKGKFSHFHSYLYNESALEKNLPVVYDDFFTFFNIFIDANIAVLCLSHTQTSDLQ